MLGDGMRCRVLLLYGHRADDRDEEEKSKMKYALHALDVFTRCISYIKVLVVYTCTPSSVIGVTMCATLF